uniref:Uncharacterized protein n=1 Tax=Zooxanthella nutricula TaxID=1333877 RepID=A0A7S2VP75_9DINO
MSDSVIPTFEVASIRSSSTPVLTTSRSPAATTTPGAVLWSTTPRTARRERSPPPGTEHTAGKVTDAQRGAPIVGHHDDRKSRALSGKITAQRGMPLVATDGERFRHPDRRSPSMPAKVNEASRGPPLVAMDAERLKRAARTPSVSGKCTDGQRGRPPVDICAARRYHTGKVNYPGPVAFPPRKEGVTLVQKGPAFGCKF